MIAALGLLVLDLVSAELAAVRLTSDQGEVVAILSASHESSFAYKPVGEEERPRFLSVDGETVPLGGGTTVTPVRADGDEPAKVLLGRSFLKRRLVGLDFEDWKVRLWPLTGRKEARDWVAGKDGTVVVPLQKGEDGTPRIRIKIDGKSALVVPSLSEVSSFLGPVEPKPDRVAFPSGASLAWGVEIGGLRTIGVAGHARPANSPLALRLQQLNAKRVLFDLDGGELRFEKLDWRAQAANLLAWRLDLPLESVDGKVILYHSEGEGKAALLRLQGVEWSQIEKGLQGPKAAERLLWIVQLRRKEVLVESTLEDGRVWPVKVEREGGVGVKL